MNGKAQLYPDCWKSLGLYKKEAKKLGGIVLLEELGTSPGTGSYSAKEFLFAFSSSFQLFVLCRYSSLWCLDSTYNICYALDINRKAFLHSIIIKHDEAGRGILVIFIIISAEN